MSRLFEALKLAEIGRREEEASCPEAFLEGVGRANDSVSETLHETANVSLESRLVVWSTPQSLAADRFRLLRIQLQKLQAAGRVKTLLVTSPTAEDGKSTVVLNLATALASRGKHRVLVLEADLRCPSLVGRLGLKRWSGLTDCLKDGFNPLSSLRCIDPLGFYLLPAGEPAESPTELLQSENFGGLMKKLGPCFDWILVDSPPTGPIADVMVLRQRADAGLLVVRSGATPRDAVSESMAQLGAGFVQAMVLNALEGMEAGYGGYYGKYYGYRSPKPAVEVITSSSAGSP
jgi:capsular exopolysaccharide synthesis family protein